MIQKTCPNCTYPLTETYSGYTCENCGKNIITNDIDEIVEVQEDFFA